MRLSRHGRARTMAVLAAAIAILATSGSVALADGETLGVIVTPPIVEPGGTITIQGPVLWTELDVVAELVDPDGATRRLGETRTAPDGSLFWTVAIPTDVPEGRFDVVVSNASGESVHAEVIVRAAVPALPILIGLGALVALGFVALSGARRRRALVPSTGVTGPEQHEDPPPLRLTS